MDNMNKQLQHHIKSCTNEREIQKFKKYILVALTIPSLDVEFRFAFFHSLIFFQLLSAVVSNCLANNPVR